MAITIRHIPKALWPVIGGSVARVKVQVGDVYRIPGRGVGIYIGPDNTWLTLFSDEDTQYPNEVRIDTGWAYSSGDYICSLKDGGYAAFIKHYKER